VKTETIEKLESAAQSWIGTPFMPNCAIQGKGVSCHNLVGILYIECGALPDTFKIPEGDPGWSRAHKDSLIEQFMDARAEFVSINGKPEPGDMLGFKIGGCVHHCGITLQDGYFVHCLRDAGASYRRLDDATYLSRLTRIWRPING
jgi:cell wall-associated NlpC family hydrolase